MAAKEIFFFVKVKLIKNFINEIYDIYIYIYIYIYEIYEMKYIIELQRSPRVNGEWLAAASLSA